MVNRLVLALCALGILHSTSPVFARHGFGRGGSMFGAAAAMARAQAAWVAREKAAEQARRAKNNQQRMQYAAEARKEGKPHLAATLYLRVALTQKDKNAPAAKAALKEMAKEGEAEMYQADKLLEEGKIVEGFEKLDYLAWAYEEVPAFNTKIEAHVTKLHHDARYESVLNEKPAADIVAEAQKMEQEGARCCAYWAYEEAAKLVPAPSALKAEERFAAMKKDPEIVAEAEQCKLLQECEKTFHSAKLLEKSLPNQAEAKFKEILGKAPRDSEVYKFSQEELAKLHAPKKKK